MKMRGLSLLLAICVFYFNTKSGYANKVPSLDVVIEEKCNSSAENPSATFLNMERALRNLDLSVPSLINVPTSDTNDFMKLCEPIAQEELYTIVKSLAGNLSLCLTEEELYLPNFLLETFNNTMDEFCKSDGWTRVTEFMLEMKGEIGKVTCPLYSRFDIEKLCVPQLNIYKNIERHSYVLTQKELCSDLEKFQDCSSNIFEQCGQHHPTMMKFTMAPILDWCNKN